MTIEMYTNETMNFPGLTQRDSDELSERLVKRDFELKQTSQDEEVKVYSSPTASLVYCVSNPEKSVHRNIFVVTAANSFAANSVIELLRKFYRKRELLYREI